jgi:phytoene/squalene synthetase
VYLPQNMLRAEGIAIVDVKDVDLKDESSHRALKRVVRRLSDTAEQFYGSAESNLDAFSPDCRIAIQSCIDVYRQLNLRIGNSSDGVMHRESVPMNEKFRVLPPSKYWRLPLAYLGAL